MVDMRRDALASRSALLDVLMRRPAQRRPIWFMRQAGRYLPEYRAVREQAGSFLDLCYNPELAAEVTVQPLRRYDLDAAILFADILVVPHAMGQGLTFAAGEGPHLAPTLLEVELDSFTPAFERFERGRPLGLRLGGALRDRLRRRGLRAAELAPDSFEKGWTAFHLSRCPCWTR